MTAVMHPPPQPIYQPDFDESRMVRVHCPYCQRLIFKLKPVPGVEIEVKCKCGQIVWHVVPIRPNV